MADIAGAAVLATGLFISKERAIELGVGRWAGDTDDENVKLPAVRDRLNQSRRAVIGLSLLALGFGLQAIGTLVSAAGLGPNVAPRTHILERAIRTVDRDYPRGDMIASDVWTKLAAIGTLSASVIALLIATVPPLWRRFRLRPRFEVRIGERAPWARPAIAMGEPFIWLRMEVTNAGRTEAENVRAYIRAWYERPDRQADWMKRDLDPTALHWVSMPYKVERGPAGPVTRDTPPVVSLPPKLGDFVDLLRYSTLRRAHELVVDDARPRGIGFEPMASTGEFVVTVTVTGDNAKNVTKHLHYRVTREDGFSGVRFDDAPAKYREEDILTTIRDMAQQAQSTEENRE